MAAEQLPVRVREFANHLTGLLASLDNGAGWCAVFWQRDPEGMRACLDGREVPPWDVVEALVQDLAAEHGPEAAAAELRRARPLHAAALLAYDTRPGGRDALGDRLDAMLQEQRYAAGRLAELGRLLPTAAGRADADAIRLDLAWARDDHGRATARCAELRRRMADLDRRAADGREAGGALLDPGGGSGEAVLDPGAVHGVAPGSGAPAGTAATDSAARDGREGRGRGLREQRRRRRGGARFAGMAEEGAAPTVAPPGAVPGLSAPAPATGRSPRGARFAGAAAEPAAAPEPPLEEVDGTARQEAAAMAETLARLRSEGRTGEAHVLLAEAAYGPAARFPLFAGELERAGLGADWATLLWEAASLPAGRLVAAADALVAAGRDADGARLLRQGVARPPGEIGLAVLGLAHEGRHREVRALLDAYVRVRTPDEAARSAGAEPETLVPLLLEAARGVSAERHRDLVHALRVAGLTG
ncbi:hypothetical protein ACIHCM_00175 [Streptomyces sp. NPDC052023]|uniref:hypothetical protein n=1 Tax=Streptomyces sp. NPDC052023 TaxID=3365681 RepID=UPI0037D2E2B0